MGFWSRDDRFLTDSMKTYGFAVLVRRSYAFSDDRGLEWVQTDPNGKMWPEAWEVNE
jgi:hypothetical protein